MITKKDILQMISHVARRSRSLPDTRLMHPKREWALGIIAFIVLIIIGGIVNAQNFRYYSSIDEQLEEGSSHVVMYKETAMREVLEYYSDRTARFQQLRNSIVPVKPVINTVVTESDNSEADNSEDNEEGDEGTDEENQATSTVSNLEESTDDEELNEPEEPKEAEETATSTEDS